jgi:DNA-binding NtrC family response regulator
MSTTQLLVVDDDSRYAASVCELLRLDGHTAGFEVDGVRALERIRTDDIAVLILDLDMPGVSGVDVLQALQAQSARPRTIVVSGIGEIDRIAPALRFTPHDYLAKPYDPKQLLASVRGALAGIRRDADNRARLAEQAIGRLTSGIAHDFNNILADVIGYTELSLGSATGTEYLKEVLAAGQRARDLISQILMLTRRDDDDAPSGSAAPIERTGRIVVVDHEVAVGDCIGDVLTNAGYDVAVFSDAATAVDHIEAAGRDVALVLADQALPQISGAQFAQRVHAMAGAPPVVVMVGYADRAERHCTPVLNKPFRIAELLDAVATFSRRAGADQ